MLPPVVVLVALVVALVWWRFAAPMRMKGVKHQETAYPFFGCLFTFMREFHRLPDYITELNHKFHGETFGMSLPRIGPFHNGAYAISSEACLEHVLGKNFANYEKGKDLHEPLEPFFGDGIFSTDGAAWVHQRKIASHMFSQRLMRESLRVAIAQGERLVHKLSLHVASGEPVDVADQFFRFTIDTFCYIAFGLELRSLEKDHPFALAFDRTQAICNNRFENPLWWVGRALRTPTERELTRHAATITSFVDSVVNARRREAEEATLGPDLLSRFLDDAKAKNTPVSNAELRDIILNFIIAGRDTTACALSWAMLELGRHPDVAAKCRAEVDVALAEWKEHGGGQGNTPPSDDLNAAVGCDMIDYNTLHDALPYLTATVTEVLRLHPSVPKQVKWAVNADTLPDGTEIPAGAAVLFSAYAMGRDPNLWPEPEVFRPERWLNVTQPSAFKYLVFNAGPRLCLGKPLAYMEIKLMLAMILSRFTFTFNGTPDDGYTNTLVLPMRSGLSVKLQKRE